MLKTEYIRTVSKSHMNADLHRFFDRFDKDITGTNGKKNTIPEAVSRKCSTLEYHVDNQSIWSLNETKIDVLRAVLDKVRLTNEMYKSFYIEKVHDYLALVIIELAE